MKVLFAICVVTLAVSEAALIKRGGHGGRGGGGRWGNSWGNSGNLQGWGNGAYGGGGRGHGGSGGHRPRPPVQQETTAAPIVDTDAPATKPPKPVKPVKQQDLTTVSPLKAALTNCVNSCSYLPNRYQQYCRNNCNANFQPRYNWHG